MSSDNKFLELQFDMKRLCDGVVHREVVTLLKNEFHLSVSFIRNLIEVELQIPSICQISLSVAGIPLDCLTDSALFPNRLWKRGERVQLSLEYYTSSAPLVSLHRTLQSLEHAFKLSNFRFIQSNLNSLAFNHMSVFPWDSSEAIGTRLYLINHGFLDQLASCIHFLNEELYMAFHDYKEYMLTHEIGEQSTTEETEEDLIRSAVLISNALDAAVSIMWIFGAKSNDNFLLIEKGLLDSLLVSGQICYQLLDCPYQRLRLIGRECFKQCLGALQGFCELRNSAIQIGQNSIFMSLLKNLIINPSIMENHPNDRLHQVYTFFCCSCHSEVSSIFCADDTYLHFLDHFTNHPIVGPRALRFRNTVNARIFYYLCLLLLNWLKSPFSLHLHKEPSSKVIQQIIDLFESFSQHIKVEDMIRYERGSQFTWGALDPFTSLFFLPNNSILGMRLYNTADSSGPQSEQLCELYFRLSLFSLDVLLGRENIRQQFIEENLLTHLIMAHWTLPNHGIYDRLLRYYPQMLNFQVPSLSDIAAIQAVRQGLKDYIHVVHFLV